jgi:hypothetical protein
MTPTSDSPASSFQYFGLEWKDFLTLSVSALALVLSLWGIISQYVESNIKEGKQQRQMLYIAMRIGHNLASAYSQRIDLKGQSPSVEPDVAVLIAQLSALGIRIRPDDLNWNDLQLSHSFEYANADTLEAQGQIENLLDAYYGQAAVAIFKAGYYLQLARLAIVLARDDERGNDQICGLWVVYGSRALETIERSYSLPHIEPEQCKNDRVIEFRKKLKNQEKLLDQRLEPRAPLSVLISR